MNFSRSFFESYGCGDLFDPRLMPYLKIKGKRVENVTIRDAGTKEIAPEHRPAAAECYHLIAMILIRAAENYLQASSTPPFVPRVHRHRVIAKSLYSRAAYAMRESANAHLFFNINRTKRG